MPALQTFVPPSPHPRLIRVLGAVNRHLILPRWCRIGGVHLPASEEEALRTDVASGVPMFFVPNHPEYFADWMLDKWLLDRVAPRMANWADPGVVNGMGRLMQKFWLGNNIVAAVRGAESAKAIEHSVAWACAGNGVLLHPEGAVNWDNEVIGPLFPGAARMAVEAARRHPSGQALLAPLAWYLRFREDVTAPLHAEIDDLAHRLSMAPLNGNPAQRLLFLVQSLVERVARVSGLVARNPLMMKYDARERLAEVLQALSSSYVAQYSLTLDHLPGESEVMRAARVARRMRDTKHPLALQAALTLESLAKLDASALSAETLTQEQIAHRLRRIRQDWVRGKTSDTFARMAPRGLAMRDAVIAVTPRVTVTGASDPALVTAQAHAALTHAVKAARDRAHAQFGPVRVHSVR